MPDENDARTAEPTQTNNSWQPDAADNHTINSLQPSSGVVIGDDVITNSGLEPSVQPANAFENDTTTGTPGTGFVPEQKKSNKAVLVAAIAVGLSALVLSSGAAAYNAWYQNPQKVLTDAITNVAKAEAVSTKSTITVSSTSTEKSTYTVDITTKKNGKLLRVDADVSSKMSEADFALNASLISNDNKKLYIKVNELKKMFEKSGLSQVYGSSKAATNLINKLDTNWIVITQADTDNLRGSKNKSTECIEHAFDKLSNDKTYSTEMENLYRKHPLIKVKKQLGGKENSLGYEIGIGKQNSIAFIDGLNETKFFKDVQKCDDSIKKLEGKEILKDYKESESAKISVWIDRWSHKPTKLEVTDKSDDMVLRSTTTFTSYESVKIDEPKNAVSYDEIKNDFDAVQNEAMQAYTSSAAITE